MTQENQQKTESRLSEVEQGLRENKVLHSQLISAVEKQTKSNDNLTKTLIEYTTRHDIVAKRQEEFEKSVNGKFDKIQSEQISQGKTVAEMKPVTDATRNMAWKLVGGWLVSSAGLAAIAAAISKAG